MTSTSEADRKRRHFSSLSSSPSEAAAVKKQPFFWPSSEDKGKITHDNMPSSILEDRLTLIKEKQLPYSHSLKAVHKSWDKLTAAVESCSVRVSDSSSGANRFLNNEDVSSPHIKEDFIKRLLETGATENSSSSIYSSRMEVDNGNTSNQLTQTLYSLVAATNDLRCLKDRLYPTFLKMGIDKVDMCGQLSLNELESENKSFRVVLDDVLVKFKSVLRELQSHCDADAKVKADLKQIRGELENEVEELQQCNSDLSALRTEMDATAGAFFPVLNIGNKLANGDKDRDKQRDLQDTESVLKELRILASSRLQELKDLHEERTHILGKSSLLEKSKSVRCISSSQAYLSLKDQLANTKEAVFKYMDLLEKRQVEKDSIVWREREMNIKNELVDVSRRFSAVADSRIATLDLEIQKQLEEKTRIKTRLGNISREKGRQEIFADMKTLISSFPDEMSSMRSQFENYKKSAEGIHTLWADVQSLSGSLCRKTKESEALQLRSADYASQLGDLNATVRDLKDSHEEFKLFMDMYKRESTDPRCTLLCCRKDIAEAKEQEYMAWAHVQSLKSSLDEQNLELRVKAANEAEAISQQMLAAAKAEIADLRQKMDDCKRDVSKHSDILKSKHEEHGTYLSEIQTIGNAYEDIVPQNQQLLVQVTERDDYNIKLFLEGVESRQMQDTLLIDKYIMDKDIRQATGSTSFLSKKSSRIEDHMRFNTDQFQKSVTFENLKKKRANIGSGLEQARSRLEELSHSKVEQSQVDYGALELELEIEKFNRKRLEDEMEIAKKKVSRLRSLIEGSSPIQKLRQELNEFKEILKCKACNDCPKEVVITKCYHLFCNPCVQKITGSRQRKCPTCSASFGPNDIKPIYI